MNPQSATVIPMRGGECASEAPDQRRPSRANRASSPNDKPDRLPMHYSGSVPHLTLVRLTAVAETSEWSISSAKRGMDILTGVVALVLLAPVFALVCALVACSSPGPIFFAQRRVGRLGQLFTIYKFRTMRTSPQSGGPSCTRSGDARITSAGRMLRKFKLDELPQFYNVLRGDMSLVGPRPKLPLHESMHMPFRPGVTGAATLAFRSEEEMLAAVAETDLEFYYDRIIKPLKAQIDSEYMEKATLFTDLATLVKTAAACAMPRRYHPLLQLHSPDLGRFDLSSFDLDHMDLSVADMGDPS